MLTLIFAFFSLKVHNFRTEWYFLMKFGEFLPKYLIFKPRKNYLKMLCFVKNIAILQGIVFLMHPVYKPVSYTHLTLPTILRV